MEFLSAPIRLAGVDAHDERWVSYDISGPFGDDSGSAGDVGNVHARFESGPLESEFALEVSTTQAQEWFSQS